jgi:uncharacterized protein
MDQKEVVNKLVRYKMLVSQHFDLDSLVLFGSYAKGNCREDSDIDVAVIVKSLDKDYFLYAPLLWKLRREIDDRIEPVLFENINDHSGFLKEILRTGITIH